MEITYMTRTGEEVDEEETNKNSEEKAREINSRRKKELPRETIMTNKNERVELTLSLEKATLPVAGGEVATTVEQAGTELEELEKATLPVVEREVTTMVGQAGMRHSADEQTMSVEELSTEAAKTQNKTTKNTEHMRVAMLSGKLPQDNAYADEIDAETRMSVAGLSERECAEMEIKTFRNEIDDMVTNLEVRQSSKLARTMRKFDEKLEAAVSRMAELGCIEEEEETGEESECVRVTEPDRDLRLSLDNTDPGLGVSGENEADLAKGHSDGVSMSCEMVAMNDVNEAKVLTQTKMSIISGLSLAKGDSDEGYMSVRGAGTDSGLRVDEADLDIDIMSRHEHEHGEEG